MRRLPGLADGNPKWYTCALSSDGLPVGTVTFLFTDIEGSASLMAPWGRPAVGAKAKVGQKFAFELRRCKEKSPVSGAFRVAGAGFEPATSGL
jgi:hypothetical protein